MDYNMGAYAWWKFDASEDFFLPKSVSFYQAYINETLGVEKSTASTESLNNMTRNEQYDYLLNNWRNWFMNVGKRQRRHILNYNAIKRNYMYRTIDGVKVYPYIKQQIEKSDLPYTLKQLAHYLHS
jgi:hypothetical protein